MNIQQAEEKDIDIIYNFIHALSRYEKREQDATLTKEQLSHWLFHQHIATALILYDETIPVGYALYYPVFASFVAEAHIHLEDMYILPEYRKQGAGHYFIEQITSILLEQGYTGMEWSALDWNTNAEKFYLSIGASRDRGRIYFSLNCHSMHDLSIKADQINRIQQMEQTMDQVISQLPNPSADDLRILQHYYETDWIKDYDADQQHQIPSFIKRGILSQDTLYNLFDSIDHSD